VYSHAKEALPVLTRILIAVSGFLQSRGRLDRARRRGGSGLKFALARPASRAPQSTASCSTRPSWQGASPPGTARGSPHVAILVEAACRSRGPRGGRGRDDARSMREALAAAPGRARGHALSRSLGASGAFPPVMVHLIAGGEPPAGSTNRSSAAARQQQRTSRCGSPPPWRCSSRAHRRDGCLVLAIVLAILLPIFTSTSSSAARTPWRLRETNETPIRLHPHRDPRRRGDPRHPRAIVVPRIMDRPTRPARGRQADVAAIVQSLKLYRLDNGFYPATDQGLAALVQKRRPIRPRQLEAGRLPRAPAQGPVGQRLPYLNPA